MYALVVHGGAGEWRPEREAEALAGVGSAAQAGNRLLAAGGSALDAVQAAVVALEDAPVFNAGTGAALNIEGKLEMDAAVMTGHDLATGAVANLRDVKNPVQVARRVMEETDHVILAGEGALRFARAMGFEAYDPVTPDRRRAFKKKLARMKSGEDAWLPRLRELLEQYPELAHGTVGAVALDTEGRLAAATSTGGVSLKLAGRVGDTPVPGAGNYATAQAASSATGRGEIIMRALTTSRVCDLVEQGYSAQEATEMVLASMVETVGDDVGVIAVDGAGRVGISHATRSMPHAWVAGPEADIQARMRLAE